MKHLETNSKPFSGLLVHPFVPIFSISYQRAAYGRQMGPDLVGSPGNQRHFQKGILPLPGNRLIHRYNGKAAWNRIFKDLYLVSLFVLSQIPLYGPDVCKVSFYYAEIILVNAPVLKCRRQNLQAGKEFV